jgi:hypothetical protein
LEQGKVRFEGPIAEFKVSSENGDFEAEVLRQLGKASA